MAQAAAMGLLAVTLLASFLLKVRYKKQKASFKTGFFRIRACRLCDLNRNTVGGMAHGIVWICIDQTWFMQIRFNFGKVTKSGNNY